MSSESGVRIRMYRQGLGDCFLLRFPGGKDGPYHILIDSGVLKGTSDSKAKMTEVARDIAKEVDGKLDLLVVTHEHWDHVSGFKEAREVWEGIKIAEVWLAWTEDPSEHLATKLRKDRENRKKKVVKKMAALRAGDPQSLRIDGERSSRLTALLGFLGVGAGDDNIGGTTEALRYISERAAKRTYCSPGEVRPLPGVKGVRVFVLGPPKDEKLIKRSDPSRRTPEVYEETGKGPAFGAANGPDGADLDQPFPSGTGRSARDDKEYQIAFREAFGFTDSKWRKLKAEALADLERLALALDGDTNNTSLALAFELGDGGPILLFPADAQVGNWVSWQQVEWKPGGKKVGIDNLFARTVLYKVGHHASHNATLKANGLEKMTHRDLVALIPVEKAMAVKKKWRMPFPPLYRRLIEKTRGRVILADASQAPPKAADLDKLTPTERKQFAAMVDTTELYHDVTISP